MKKSQIPGFYKLTPKERLQHVKEFAGLTDEEAGNNTVHRRPLNMELANVMIENVIGAFPLPLGVAMNFVINNKEYIIPMATEEPSVIAAASYGAKMATKEKADFSQAAPTQL